MGTLSPLASRRPLALLAFVLAAATGVISGCAGYQVGARSLFRPEISTVYVPVFESDSFRPHLGERLTEAVVKRIDDTTSYRVVSSSTADSVLTGRIVSDSKAVLVENRNDEPRDIAATLTVEVQWTDHRGQLLAAPTVIPVPAILFSVDQSRHFIPEAGQSIATAQQAAIEQIAAQIVGQMERPW